MIRIVLTMLMLFFNTLLVGILIMIFGWFNHYSKLINWLGKFWCHSILWTAGVKVEYSGLEKLDRNTTYVFAGNHQSHYDVPATFTIIPHTVRFIGKKELFKIPVFGWAMHAAGMLKIDRGHQRKARETMDKAVEKMKKGISVILFPEGTRSSDGKIRAFKKGGFVIAIKGNFPIVPVVISGSRYILEKNTLRLKPGKIKVEFLDPVPTDEYSYEDRNTLAEEIRKKIVERFDSHFNEGTA